MNERKFSKRDRRGKKVPGNAARKAGPERLSNILADLIIQRGYARQLAASAFQDAWKAATDARMHSSSRPGNVRGGVLEVTVKNSIVMQELTFQKRQILKKINAEIAGNDKSISDIRFRVGQID